MVSDSGARVVVKTFAGGGVKGVGSRVCSGARVVAKGIGTGCCCRVDACFGARVVVKTGDVKCKPPLSRRETAETAGISDSIANF